MPHQVSLRTKVAPVLASNLVSFQGPVPFGSLSSVAPSGRALGMIGDCGLSVETRYGKLPFGPSSLKTTVLPSGEVTEPLSMTPLSAELPAALSRSNVEMMSSVVSGAPSFCQVTPSRRVKVHSVASAFGFHSVARPGFSCRSPPV